MSARVLWHSKGQWARGHSLQNRSRVYEANIGSFGCVSICERLSPATPVSDGPRPDRVLSSGFLPPGMWAELCPPENHVGALTYRLPEWVCVSAGCANGISEGEGIGARPRPPGALMTGTQREPLCDRGVGRCFCRPRAPEVTGRHSTSRGAWRDLLPPEDPARPPWTPDFQPSERRVNVCC